MNYSPDEFHALEDEIDRQGGVLLPDICLPQAVTFTQPPYKQRTHTEKKITCGCGNLCRFVSVYKQKGERKPSFVTACAVCDSMGAWPRYEEVVRNASDPEDDV